MVEHARAPLFRDAFALCEWLLARLQRNPTPLPRALCGNALRLLEAVTLALQDRGRAERVDEADERLAALRVQLRLAERLQLLDHEQALFALDCAHRIGRQLGGWQKSFGSA